MPLTLFLLSVSLAVPRLTVLVGGAPTQRLAVDRLDQAVVALHDADSATIEAAPLSSASDSPDAARWYEIGEVDSRGGEARVERALLRVPVKFFARLAIAAVTPGGARSKTVILEMLPPTRTPPSAAEAKRMLDERVRSLSAELAATAESIAREVLPERDALAEAVPTNDPLVVIEARLKRSLGELRARAAGRNPDRASFAGSQMKSLVVSKPPLCYLTGSGDSLRAEYPLTVTFHVVRDEGGTEQRREVRCESAAELETPTAGAPAWRLVERGMPFGFMSGACR